MNRNHLFLRALCAFTAAICLLMLSSCEPGHTVVTRTGTAPRADVVTSVDEDEFLHGFCPLPKTEKELKDTALSLKRYGESYLSGRRVSDEAVYVSSDCAIYIRKVTFGALLSKITTYVADIYLDNISMLSGCVLRDSEGKLSSGSPEDVLENYDVLFLLNGDYLSIRKWGLYVRNGELIRNKTTEGVDICVITKDGAMTIYNGDDFDKNACLSSDDVWHVISFGPSLLNEDGTPKNEDSEFHITDKYSRFDQYDSSVGFPVPNPRAMIGQARDGHYILVAVDGRNKGYSKGMTFPELSHLMYEEGASVAYNLDGGGSVFMYFDGKPVNVNSGGRNPSDYFCILREKTEEEE